MCNPSEKLLVQAGAARREHRPADARRDLIQAVEIARKTGTHAELAAALAALGRIERDLRNLETARECYGEAVSIYRSECNPLKLAHAIRHMGDVCQELSDLELAGSCYREALDLYRSNPQTTPLELANAIRSAAILRDRIGEVNEATALWFEARTLYGVADAQAGVMECTRRAAGLDRDKTDL